MKILPVDKIREADAFTILNEPVESIELMERAARACFKWIKKRTNSSQPVKVFCGPGNNGGDGLAIARLLAKNYFEVQVFIFQPSGKFSNDFITNLDQLKQYPEVSIIQLNEGDKIPEIHKNELVIDAILGSGLTKPVQGYIAQIIRQINSGESITISIDVPSGLFCDENSSATNGAIIEADYTLTFQFPKLAFLLPENDQYVGQWEILPIGLSQAFVDGVSVQDYLIGKEDCRLLLKTRNKFAHKGTFGHALNISGSYGKMGCCGFIFKSLFKVWSRTCNLSYSKVGLSDFTNCHSGMYAQH